MKTPPLMPLLFGALALSSCGFDRAPREPIEQVFRDCTEKALFTANQASLCRAYQTMLQEVPTRPLSIVYPRRDAASADLIARTYNLSVRGTEFAKANTFPVRELRTGTLQTLDGKSHQVECSILTCTIDGTVRVTQWAGIHVNFTNGNLYSGDAPTDFLKP